jgi:rhodanese-related sulfurtransferase
MIMITAFSTLAALVVLGIFFSRPQSRVNLVSVRETFDRGKSDSSVLLLDVRTPREFESGHIEKAILIPVQELEQRIGELDQYRGKTIIAYCRSGNRSGTAAQILGKNGFTAFNMEGGVIKWKSENLPLVESTDK